MHFTILIKRLRLYQICLSLKNELSKPTKIIKILMLYKYIALIITSIMYFYIAFDKKPTQKYLIILGLSAACILISYLYIKNRSNKKHKYALFLTEMIENSIFLIISGGFMSPFIWYFISTVYIAAVEVSERMALLCSGVYFIIACTTTGMKLFADFSADVAILYMNIAFSYVIVIGAALQLIKYVVKVEEKSTYITAVNAELMVAKQKLENTLKYSINLYETIGIFELSRSTNVLIDLLKHFRNIIGIDQMMLIQLIPFEKKGTYVSCGIDKISERQVAEAVLKEVNSHQNYKQPLFKKEQDKYISIYHVLYDNSPYGLLVFMSDQEWIKLQDEENNKEVESSNDDSYLQNVILVFLTVTGVVLKKLVFDDLGKQLLISEEQNRIACEIHDIVLQKLFAISCKLYVLSVSDEIAPNTSIIEELQLIKKATDAAMRELREAIYGISWQKEGEDTFKTKLQKHVDEIGQLTDIEINLLISGDTQKLNVSQKNGIYRVICEATNNAIRHGRARNIELRIEIKDIVTIVCIADDGIGFDYNKYLNNNEKGLGIANIIRVAELLNGHAELLPRSSGGTEIILSIPIASET